MKYKEMMCDIHSNMMGGFYLSIDTQPNIKTFEDLVKLVSKYKKKNIVFYIIWRKGNVNTPDSTVRLVEDKIEEYPQYFNFKSN